MTQGANPPGSAGELGDLARTLAEIEGTNAMLAELVQRAVAVVPCDWAGVAAADRLGPRRAALSASSDPEILEPISQIAARVGDSPGYAAFREGGVVHCPDLTQERRFGRYPERVVARTPVRSVLSLALRLHDRSLGVLTLYAARAGAFGPAAQGRAEELADLAVVAVDAATSADRAHHLGVALEHSRVIGIAIGVLVERHRITPDAAFDMLRLASQHTNRKLAEIADELVRTGELTGGEPPSQEPSSDGGRTSVARPAG